MRKVDLSLPVPVELGNAHFHRETQEICCDFDTAVQELQSATEQELSNSISNILNANRPGYQRVSELRGPDGEYLIDRSPGKLVDSGRDLDFGIEGPGTGFLLADGTHTRDGRFRMNARGELMHLASGKPLALRFEDGQQVDLSRHQIKVSTDGAILDRRTGSKLASIQAELGEGAKIRQGYVEKSNVNLPLEFAAISQIRNRQQAASTVSTSDDQLDRQALGLLQGL